MVYKFGDNAQDGAVVVEYMIVGVEKAVSVMGGGCRTDDTGYVPRCGTQGEGVSGYCSA